MSTTICKYLVSGIEVSLIEPISPVVPFETAELRDGQRDSQASLQGY